MSKKYINALTYHAEALAAIPSSALAAVMMRHAERPKIPKGEHGNDLLLTEKGHRDAFAAGELMKGRITRLLHSPVPRCRQTAEDIQKGSEVNIAPENWDGLRCDIYTPDFERAKSTLSRLVMEDNFYDEFIDHMSACNDKIPYSGFISPFSATVKMINGIVNGKKHGLCIGVTHDWLVNVAAAYAVGKPVNRDAGEYADYLDALFVWQDNNQWHFYHKGRAGKCPERFSEAL